MMDDKSQVFIFDDIQVEPRSLKLIKSGIPVQVEPKAFKVLLFLIDNRGRVVEKDEILDSVWKETSVTENALTREIAKLRRVLGDDPKQSRYIQTVHTRGYRFIAEVEVSNGVARNGEAAPSNGAQPSSFQQSGHGVKRETEKRPLYAGKILRRAVLPVAAACLSVIAALLALKFFREPVLTAGLTVVEITPITTAPELGLNPTFSPDGSSLAYSSDRSGGFEIYAKPLAAGGREIQLTADGNQNMEPAWSPDGNHIAYHSAKRGGIWLMPALGGVSRQLTAFGCHPAWSRDGSMIAFQSESFHDMLQPYASSAAIWIVPAEGGEPNQITEAGRPAGGHLFPSWSRDGKRIAFLNANIESMQIWSITVAEGRLKQLTTAETGDKADVSYSPDGESIFFTAGMTLFNQRLSQDEGDPIGPPVKVADLGSMPFRHPAISADGKKIAYSAWTMKSNVWSIPLSPRTHKATGSPVALTNELNSRNGLTAFSPDGKKIAFTSMRRGAGYQLHLMDTDGKNRAQLTSDQQAAYSPSWSAAAGDRIAFYCMRGGHSTLSAITIDSRKESVLAEVDGLDALRLSPDAKQVAFIYAPDNFFNIGVMAADGERLRQLTFEKTFTGFPCWSPDGSRLAFQMKRGDDMQLMLMPSIGGTPLQLTFDSGDKWPYSWSPDGSKIAFASSRNGVWNVRWISVSDKTETQLTSNTRMGVVIRFPDWSPLGNQIVYEQAEIIGNIHVMSLK
ncbi:MAG TPA: winged helix-turn-helix domain-containing protein [Blastocatellia bacterium]|nr:winged helix-turn-helix domain-containing protein [Blastocatellia bacterium]